jgi:hypothetical protein
MLNEANLHQNERRIRRENVAFFYSNTWSKIQIAYLRKESKKEQNFTQTESKHALDSALMISPNIQRSRALALYAWFDEC